MYASVKKENAVLVLGLQLTIMVIVDYSVIFLIIFIGKDLSEEYGLDPCLNRGNGGGGRGKG